MTLATLQKLHTFLKRPLEQLSPRPFQATPFRSRAPSPYSKRPAPALSISPIPNALFPFQAPCSHSKRPFLLSAPRGLLSIPNGPFRFQPPYPKEHVPSREPKEPVPSREPFPLHVRSARSAACPERPFPSENVLYNKRGESRVRSSIDGGMPVALRHKHLQIERRGRAMCL